MKDLTLILTGAALAASALPLAAQAQAASPVGGEVMFVSGRADRVRPDGATQIVGKGMQVLEGDRIKTQGDSHVYVRLRDGGLLVVRPASELHVDVWRFDPSQPQDSRIRYTLENGVARHVSGEAAKAARDKFRFNTPMAAIGVRGTDFTVLAEPSVTRISVQSGGVVVSSLGNGCRAEALGPCEGASAVELFATAKDKILQLRMGERKPELVDDPSAAPDKARPAAAGEPTAKRKNIDVDLSESRVAKLAELPAPEPKAPAEPLAVWGRWAAIADKDPGVVNAEDLLAGRSLVGINRLYLLAANKAPSSFELPGSGMADFKLTGHEGVITDNATGQHHATTASDGALRIDFASRRFETSMNVKAGELAAEIGAKGSVESNGRFLSDAFVSKSIIQGIVGGKQSSEAFYLYQRAINERFEASGAASWRK